MAANALLMLRQALPGLSTADSRIARAVIDNPTILDRTITEVATLCKTSPGTVARFCQKVGFSGYREFRIEVAAAAGREQAQRDRFQVDDGEINRTDSAEDVVAKIAYQEVQAIEETAKALDLATLDRVVTAISASPRIDVYGFGSSGLTAQDLQQKLYRIGLSATSFSDMHLAWASAALQRPGGVAVAISHSGLTSETSNALKIARAAGATTVGITNSADSPLAEHCDFVLTTQARENRYRAGAMSSRIAQLALVDILFVRIAQSMYDDMTESLRLTYEAVQSHRMRPDVGTAN
ncbi:MurR/RpiR family transcriptional regulator [Arthrobacter sp. AL08]|uniref:MurR/RpiR family transcriptional regulator n=1 Tax=unclassified Arthrobacter TaxID=235627 RepID=UPI001CFFAF97|nr:MULTISPECIES: MurR/RpiR family transcriptional regulator [unclassified Arthrobacter]MCB5282936.1 putative HTH-type transcriptional regulator YbbH [Arthrobacter sp. ES1]MDD1476104.1 MurR/RpiR family transcriptional regulator [Arthrobacter sp. H16F315]MDI3242110.1 MurR/RpiR family transcriptional regulator [Arthrobacter sp. AL05]MDI3277950.1 MurR/RpiR family transcriptional regulator [Arthrobacter sp. AL08]WGZ79438.1 MurR/RpiR family transcriptional regulator [Arthrobacter sp. EM1]